MNATLTVCFIPKCIILKKKGRLPLIVVVFNLRHCLKLYKITYFGAMLQLKLVEESPSVSQVRFNLHRPQEPLSGFGDFALTPEQP